MESSEVQADGVRWSPSPSDSRRDARCIRLHVERSTQRRKHWIQCHCTLRLLLLTYAQRSLWAIALRQRSTPARPRGSSKAAYRRGELSSPPLPQEQTAHMPLMLRPQAHIANAA